MAEEKPRIARLTAIITQIQSKNLVTAREMADKHQVSIRTIYRDIRTLEQSGIPVVTEEGKGYSMMEGYKVPPVMFTEDEANALITAEQIISRNKDKSLTDHYKNAIEKLKSVLKNSQKDKTELLSERLVVRSNFNNVQTSNYLIQIQKSITNFEVIQLDYLSLEENATIRKVEPFALIHSLENWLLIAHCRLRNEFRTFRLDRIQQITATHVLFTPHEITLSDFFKDMKKNW